MYPDMEYTFTSPSWTCSSLTNVFRFIRIGPKLELIRFMIEVLLFSSLILILEDSANTIIFNLFFEVYGYNWFDWYKFSISLSVFILCVENFNLIYENSYGFAVEWIHHQSVIPFILKKNEFRSFLILFIFDSWPWTWFPFFTRNET